MGLCAKAYLAFGQLATVVFVASYAVTGIYCYAYGALVYKDGDENRKGEEVHQLAARNELQVCMMGFAGSAATLSLITSVVCRYCHAQKFKDFVEQIWARETGNKEKGDLEEKDLLEFGEEPGATWFLGMLERYELEAPRKRKDEVPGGGEAPGGDKPRKPSLHVRVLRACTDTVNHWLCTPLIMCVGTILNFGLLVCAPYWWWWRIAKHGHMDFSTTDMNDDTHYTPTWRHEARVMGFIPNIITPVGIILFIWHHSHFMVFDWFVSCWSAASFVKKIEPATTKMEDTSKLATNKDLDWGKLLSDLMKTKTDLEDFWKSWVVMLPWVTFTVVGMVLALLGISVLLNEGIDPFKPLSRMGLCYFGIGCCLILGILFLLSEIALKFYKGSSSPGAAKCSADRFLLVYVRLQHENAANNERPELDVDPGGAASVSYIAPSKGKNADIRLEATARNKGTDEFLYLEHLRDFINYLRGETIGVRMKGGIVFSRDYALLVLKTMVSSCGILFIVHKGLLQYMKENLTGSQDGQCEHADNISTWMKGEMKPVDVHTCCTAKAQDGLFCEDPVLFRLTGTYQMVMKDQNLTNVKNHILPNISSLIHFVCDELKQNTEMVPKHCTDTSLNKLNSSETSRLFLQREGATQILQSVTAITCIFGVALAVVSMVGFLTKRRLTPRRSLTSWAPLVQEDGNTTADL